MRALLLLTAGLFAGMGAGVRADEPAGPVAAEPTVKNDKIRLDVLPVAGSPSGPGLAFDIDDTSSPSGEEAATGNEFVVAPVPFINPLFGLGLAGGAAYIYHPPGEDRTLPAWTTGIGGFYSENNSWGVAIGHKMNLHHDIWRFFGLAGYGDVNYDFYGIGDSAAGNARLVSLAQTVLGGSVEGLFRVREHLYGGLSYSLSRVETRLESTTLPPWINDIITRGQLAATLSTPSLRLQWDSRESSFLPTRGWLVDGEAAFSDEMFGSEFTYQAYSLAAKHYWALSESQTMAVFGYGRFAFGDVPFFSLSMIGAKGNLRGYPVGRYQDRMALTGQVEYRWQVWRRLGVVAFAGVGAVAPDLNGFTHADTLPSVGGGVRYLLTEKNKLNFRLDVAWGRDERLIYLGIGEAF